MDEAVAEIAAKTGLDPAMVRKAIGIIVNFLAREGPPQQIQLMMDKLPGAKALADQFSGASGGLLGAFNDLTAAGLSMSETQQVATGFIGFARTRMGSADVDAVIRSIPGLSQFI